MDQAKRVGARRRCPLFLSLTWRREGSANVLGAGNYVLILGFLHHHQLRSAWTAALGNLFSKTNRNVFCTGSLATRMGSNCPLARKLEPRPSIVLRRHAGPAPPQAQATGRLHGPRDSGPLCAWAPEARERLAQGHTARSGGPEARSLSPRTRSLAGLCGMDIILGCLPGLEAK